MTASKVNCIETTEVKPFSKSTFQSVKSVCYIMHFSVLLQLQAHSVYTNISSNNLYSNKCFGLVDKEQSGPERNATVGREEKS